MIKSKFINNKWFKFEINESGSFNVAFDSLTGGYMRSDLFKDNKILGDPFMSEFPELLDVGIMGHCKHGASGLCIQAGVQCYQDGLHSTNPNMKLEDFKKIVEECEGKTFQIALGGCGDPDQHENFKDILELCREHHIVPNFTSSGLGFNDEIVKLCKEYCGAVAISWYRHEYTMKSINMLINADIKTNIHYVLGNNTIDEAIDKLENNGFPEGINAIIFLLHKPVGLGEQELVLNYDDPKVAKFFELIDKGNYPFKIGFDSCSVPGLINFTKSIDKNTFDTCEGGRWSGYISADMKMIPCSFDNQDMRWAVDLNNHTIEEAWNSEQFEDFRNHFRNSCSGCKDREECRGGCPIRREVVLCNREEKELV